MSRLKIRLFEGEPTLAQQLVVACWAVNLGFILLLWLTTSVFSGSTALLNAFGMLFGLLAVFFALTQFMLMGRIFWIERQFGLDRLASYHRVNGYLAITFILLHPIFITLSYSLENHVNLWQQYLNLISQFPYVWMAFISEILFILVAASSIYIVRKRLKFESWYFVHLSVYAAIVLAPLHQLALGMSFAGHPLSRAYWIGLYTFVALNVLIWRFGMPVWNFLQFKFVIDKVVAETPTTTSVYIRGQRLGWWRMIPGQFVFVRIYAKGFWWQEHPFSLSMIPHDNLLRITIRHVGDYTTAIADLQPGKRVMVSGPYGRFTNEIARTNKRLFVAGGVGITPIRSLIEEALAEKRDTILIYGNRSPDDVVFEDELAAFTKKGLKIVNVFSEAPTGYRGETGYVDAERIKRLVPDCATRDIYLCGPPPMMLGIIEGLSEGGEAPANLHYERFALHNSR